MYRTRATFLNSSSSSSSSSSGCSLRTMLSTVWPDTLMPLTFSRLRAALAYDLSTSKRRVLSQLIVNPFHHPLLNGAADSVHSLSQRLLESRHSISVKNLQYRFLDNFLKGGQ